jgi:hypothetical protein
MMAYGMMLQEVTGAEVVTGGPKWLKCVLVKEDTELEV